MKHCESVQNDFQKVNERLDSMDGRLVNVEHRLGNIEQDVKEMKSKFDELYNKLDEFIALYQKHEQKLLMMGNHLRRLEERIIKLEAQKQ